MPTLSAVDRFEIEGAHKVVPVPIVMVFPFPHIYICGTVRTPITLISACVPFLKRYTKGTVRNTSVHLQFCDLGIHKVEMALAFIGNVENK
jgi:hypothetical protein